jgi:hypothetical protein
MLCPNEVKFSGATAGRRLASILKATLTRNPVFAQRGIMAVRGNQLLVNKSDKMEAGNPPIVAASRLPGNSAATCRPDLSVLSRIGPKRIASALHCIGPRAAKHRCIEITRTA